VESPGTLAGISSPGEGAAPAPRRVAVLLAVLAVATSFLIGWSGGNLALALAPTLLTLVLWFLWSVPLRVPMLLLLTLAWVLETPGDVFACGLVTTPWKPLGAVLWSKLSLTIPIGALVFSGFDLLALLLFAIIVHRRATHSTLDRIGWVETPSPLSTFAWLSLAAIAWMSLYGLARGGSFRFILWQDNRWLYLPLVFALMRHAIRGSEDAKTVGLIILGVGLFRSAEAILFRSMYSIEVMPHATTHHDSVLFGTCVGVLGAMLLEMPSPRTARFCALTLPVYVLAMKANGRRLVWAEVGLIAIFYWLITAWRPLKRSMARVLVLASLPLLLYGVAGWNSEADVFRPVHKIRSMMDADKNYSTRWRDWENHDLVHTFSLNPLLGQGFGHPFEQVIKLPDVTSVYELEPYIPHNSVLGLWAFGGLLGFALLWAMFPVGMFFTVRAYRWARTPLERVTALGAAAAQLCYLLQGYGDLGFGTWGPVFTVAAAWALVGKICVANGAWVPSGGGIPIPAVPPAVAGQT
jgi:O-antigen ligase